MRFLIWHKICFPNFNVKKIKKKEVRRIERISGLLRRIKNLRKEVKDV